MAPDEANTGYARPGLYDAAARLGVVDALLFRRVSTATWAHLGGFGRGRGWAGVVDVDVEADSLLLALVAEEIGSLARFDHPSPDHVVGPYYARSGAVVRVSNDVVVVLANPNEPLDEHATDDGLRELARLVDANLEEVSPSKRLGDELEVLHAVRAVVTTSATTLHGTLEHIVGVAVEALSCEFGVLRDGAGRVAVMSTDGEFSADPAELGASLTELARQAGRGTLCLQDVSSVPGLAPLGFADGVRSLLVIPIPAPLGGVLVAAHTSVAPRGFTNLCQRLGEQVADTASVIAHTASLREDLRVIADEQSRTARTDALTGLGNRLCWDEALAASQQQVDAGASITVITLDVDGLKELNDTYGHDAGDNLLKRCADILREHCRTGDVVARLGGDEFALLLPVDHDLAVHRLDALSAHLSPATSCRQTVAASVGAGTARVGERVADAVRDADASMYAQKRARRAAVAPQHRAAV